MYIAHLLSNDFSCFFFVEMVKLNKNSFSFQPFPISIYNCMLWLWMATKQHKIMISIYVSWKCVLTCVLFIVILIYQSMY